MGKTKQKGIKRNRLLSGTDYVIMPGENPILEIQGDVSKKAIGGFHTLCADVGEIPGHPLSGCREGDILPQSLWSDYHRPSCPDPRGFVYDPRSDLWVRVYLEQDKTRLINLSYDDFIAYGKERGWRLPTHEEFITAAEGSNEMTNIFNSSRPERSGGHVDQLERRMISNIGCEDCCGVLWQYLSTPHPTISDYGLLAGGNWDDAAICGSRFRVALYCRWSASTSIGARFVSEPLQPKTKKT
ncbi:MAG: hypothetical protein NT047_00705 [Deltaproteobacteria bacterium]|nr:hypothetical protein [Deltaproteobacteria bacterium]